MTIRERANKLIARLRDEDYYFRDFMLLCVEKEFWPPPRFGEGKTDSEIVSLFNQFWIALPDSKEIRRGPFFELCDLCEEVFNDTEADR